MGISYSREYLYVTDAFLNEIFQFKVELSLSLEPNRYIRRTTGEFSSPRNLTVSTNGDVYVATITAKES